MARAAARLEAAIAATIPARDATRLVFGFDAEGKITGIGIQSMEGD
jgi:hypothetical protein